MKAMYKKKLQLGKKTKKSSLLGSSSKSKIEFLEVEMLVSQELVLVCNFFQRGDGDDIGWW